MLELIVHRVHGRDVSGGDVVRHVLLPRVDDIFGEVGIRASERQVLGSAQSVVNLEVNVRVVVAVHGLDLARQGGIRVAGVHGDDGVGGAPAPHVSLDERSDTGRIEDGVARPVEIVGV